MIIKWYVGYSLQLALYQLHMYVYLLFICICVCRVVYIKNILVKAFLLVVVILFCLLHENCENSSVLVFSAFLLFLFLSLSLFYSLLLLVYGVQVM